MNGRQFALYLARDLHCVCGCVGREDTFVPQHRINRGMGGSKVLDRPANVLVMCSEVNGRIESSSHWAEFAREHGWKLSRWDSPETTPFLDLGTNTWHLVDNLYNRTVTEKRAA
ncbi:hypothetical protein QFZ79_002932 [Arthrobacter sp. V4I6]|uniref:hypothetical protein n=1 Tax=Arthrobacter sp. V4I6 TaxID=3042281 RepID=UPI00278A9114|nr:hypothetical protein [Arthrobacter sp. V4I6]MDQ0854821.1 hypothetical protein [Arthrobacter sp. V4I6]